MHGRRGHKNTAEMLHAQAAVYIRMKKLDDAYRTSQAAVDMIDYLNQGEELSVQDANLDPFLVGHIKVLKACGRHRDVTQCQARLISIATRRFDRHNRQTQGERNRLEIVNEVLNSRGGGLSSPLRPLCQLVFIFFRTRQ